jgi:C4-dicarboxylate-binding protein DctP
MKSNHIQTLNRRRFLTGTLGVMGAAAIGSPAIIRAQTPIVFRIATIEAIGSPMTVSFDKAAALIRQRSGGRIEVQHFPASQLGGPLQLVQNSRVGSIQCTSVGFDADEDLAPEVATAALGFVFKDEAHVDKVILGDLGRQLAEIAAKKTGAEYVAYGETGFRHLLATRKVTNLDELKGLKLRVPDTKAAVDFWRTLGASPTPLPYPEQYNALSTGIIQGLDSDPFNIIGFKWYEHAKHYSMTSNFYLIKCVRVNAAWLAKLPPDLQQIVRTTLAEAFAEQRANSRAEYGKAVNELRKDGVQVYQVSDLPEWRKRSRAFYDSYVARFPTAKPMLEALLAAA